MDSDDDLISDIDFSSSSDQMSLIYTGTETDRTLTVGEFAEVCNETPRNGKFGFFIVKFGLEF